MPGLDAMIASLRSLPRQLAERAAAIAADKIRQALEKTASAGQTPDGQAWAPKKDGGRAMPNAASHIKTQALGNVVRVTLEGPDVYHHYSKKKAEPRRQVIPDGGAEVPEVVRKALDEATSQAFRELAGGKR